MFERCSMFSTLEIYMYTENIKLTKSILILSIKLYNVNNAYLIFTPRVKKKKYNYEMQQLCTSAVCEKRAMCDAWYTFV